MLRANDKMKTSAFMFFSLMTFISSAYAGKLYSFDKNVVVINALNHIQLRFSDLANKELKPRPLQTRVNRSGRLVVSVTFSYEVENPESEFGILYVCAQVNEDGELLKIQRDIAARKGLGGTPMPLTFGCW